MFVAEKMAALDVVKNKMDHVGLGDFCLEMHSHKSDKKGLLDDIKEQKEKRTWRGKARGLREAIQMHERRKKELSDYANLINKRWGRTDLSIHQLLMSVARLKNQFKGRLGLEDIETSGIREKEVTSFILKELHDSVEILNGVRSQVGEQAEKPEIENHPWYGIEKMEGLNQRRLVGNLKDWNEALGEVAESFSRLFRESGVSNIGSESLESLGALCASVEKLPDYKRGAYLELLPSLVRNAEESVDFGNRYQDIFQKKQGFRLVFKDELFQADSNAMELKNTMQSLKDMGFSDGRSIFTISSDVKSADKAERTLSRIAGSIALLSDRLPEALGGEAAISQEGLGKLSAFMELFNRLWHGKLYELRNEDFDDDRIDEAFKRLNSSECEGARESHPELLELIDMDKLPSKQKLRSWRGYETKGFLWRLFSDDARRVWREQKELYLDKPTYFQRNRLNQLINYRHALDELKQIKGKEPVFKKLYGDFGVDIAPLNDLRDWYKDVRREYGRRNKVRSRFAEFLFSASVESLSSVSEIVNKELNLDIQEVMDFLESIKKDYPEYRGFGDEQKNLALSEESPMVLFRQRMEEIEGEVERSCKDREDLDFSSAFSDAGQLCRLHESACELARTDTAKTLSARIAKPYLREISAGSRDAVQFMTEVIELAGEHSNLVAVLAENRDDVSYSELKKRLSGLSHFVESALKKQSIFVEEGTVRLAGWMEACGSGFRELRERNNRAIKKQNLLNTWQEFLRSKDEVKKKLAEKGLQKLMEAVDQNNLEYGELKDAITFAFHFAVAEEIFISHPELVNFQVLEHKQKLKLYIKYDEEILKLQRQQIAYRASQAELPEGIKSRKAPDRTEMSLLEHEQQKRRRHIPIRDLLVRAQKSIQGLKPCFMMSPMSIAQYLKPRGFEFDLVIMDEASQIKPEYAFGAIARGKSVVVVGDTKQLPPTNFFQKVIEEDDDEDSIEDSIIEMTSRIFASRRLMWHYRSKHESLIAFSNKYFYDSKLFIYPSPHRQNEEFGIKFNKIEGEFKAGKNRIEAEAVVRQAREHVLGQRGREKDEVESLGVVAMNEEQRKEIASCWEKRIKEDPDLRNTFDLVEIGLEPFFIKNLESVQGDERDVIMISMTYGPEKVGGRVAQRFGPINVSGGERRLNVLFTRAKKRMHVFSSMAASDIVPKEAGEQGVKQGVKVLKAFLDYCASGHLHSPESTGREPDSDFEIAVMEMLKTEGYDCEAQVGVNRYFIDVGVKNPGRPGEFLMGIECDGATYHSAKSTRDRDCLRQEILEGLGWKIRRIWSTDWYKDPETQLQPILNELGQLGQESKAAREVKMEYEGTADGTYADMEEADREEEAEFQIPQIPEPVTESDNQESTFPDKVPESIDLKSRLERLAKKIKVKFPDMEDGRRLLRPAMIEALVDHQPTGREEFREWIPLDLREKTNPDEAGDYLDTVLELIDEYKLSRLPPDDDPDDEE